MKKNIIIRVAWLLLFFITIALFVYAGNVKDQKLCRDIKVEIMGKKEYVFVNEEKIKSIIAANGGRPGYIKDSINLQNIEKVLYKDVWVKSADVYFDNNNILQVKIDQSDPIARIFTTQGTSFYIDSAETYLPVNASVTTRLPVFTSFPQDGLRDSLLITDIKNLSQFMNRDTFWSAMFSQINIINNNKFEMVPVLGNHLVYIGNAEHLDEKFNKLYSFYKQVWIDKGLDKYKKINVEYAGQIVATLRDSANRKDAMFGVPANVYDSVPVIDSTLTTPDVAPPLEAAPEDKSAEIVPEKKVVKPVADKEEKVTVKPRKQALPKTNPTPAKKPVADKPKKKNNN